MEACRNVLKCRKLTILFLYHAIQIFRVKAYPLVLQQLSLSTQ